MYIQYIHVCTQTLTHKYVMVQTTCVCLTRVHTACCCSADCHACLLSMVKLACTVPLPMGTLKLSSICATRAARRCG